MEVKKDPGADTPPHMANFLAACRSRNYKDLHADVAIGVMSADLCHLANASYRAGRKLAVDAAKGRFTGEGAAEGNQYLTRRQVPGSLCRLSPPSSPPPSAAIRFRTGCRRCPANRRGSTPRASSSTPSARRASICPPTANSIASTSIIPIPTA